MTEEKMKNEIVLYLTVGKEVKMEFDHDDCLEKIRLSTNKVGELFRNNIVDKESIFDVSTIGLITKNNFVSYVRLRDGVSKVLGDSAEKYVIIDQKKTSALKGNKTVSMQGYFIFFVSKEERIKKASFSQTFNHQKRYYKNSKRN